MSNESEMKYFCVGLGLGVAAAFLLAPKSGAESRQLFQNKTKEVADSIKDRAATAVSTAADALERSSYKLRHQKEQFVAAVEAGKAAFQHAGTAAHNSVMS